MRLHLRCERPAQDLKIQLGNPGALGNGLELALDVIPGSDRASIPIREQKLLTADPGAFHE